MNSSIGECAAFGPFRLFASARVLERDGVTLQVGSRALDILIALIERSGEIVNHRELIARAWRGLVVDTVNLRVQVTHLRKSLGDGKQGARYIANVPGQGYAFVAQVSSAQVQRRPIDEGVLDAARVLDNCQQVLEAAAALAQSLSNQDLRRRSDQGPIARTARAVALSADCDLR